MQCDRDLQREFMMIEGRYITGMRVNSGELSGSRAGGALRASADDGLNQRSVVGKPDAGEQIRP